MRRTDSSPKPRTQVGRPGDPATRRPGDPATRRPGDPATRLNYTLGTLGGGCQPPARHRHDPGTRSHAPHGGGDIRPNPVQPSRHDHLPCLRRRVRRTRTSARNPHASLPYLYRSSAPGERPRATPCAPGAALGAGARGTPDSPSRGTTITDSHSRTPPRWRRARTPGAAPCAGPWPARCATRVAPPARAQARLRPRMPPVTARPALRVRISANRVVTGGKIGLRASRGKDRDKNFPSEALVTRW